MKCPHFRKGKLQDHCSVYIGRLMVPSKYESEYFCCAPAYLSCAWYLSSAGAEQHISQAIDLGLDWMANDRIDLVEPAIPR